MRSRRSTDEGVITLETGAKSDPVLVRIRDDGRGTSEEQAKHMFDMAWSDAGGRTKMRMGLAAAHATTKRHRGEIEVASAPGEETTVTFTFPLSR